MSVATTDLSFAVSNGEVILIVVAVAVPIAAISFAAGAGRSLRELGRGPLSVEFEADLPQRPAGEAAASGIERELEIRQLLEAKAYRQASRGEAPLDVDGELERLLAAGPPAAPDDGLRAEVRQLVIARNERRARQGHEPLDVEAEVERQLAELEGLGQ